MPPVPLPAPRRVLLLSASDVALAGGVDPEAVQGVRASVDAISAVLGGADIPWTHAAVACVEDIVAAVRSEAPTLVVNLVESLGGHDAHESSACAVLELLGVAYTGADPLALALCQRKPVAKTALRGLDLPTAPWLVLRPEDLLAQGSAARLRDRLEEEVGFPAIVKPACADASCGIDAGAVVGDAVAALERAAWAWEQYGPEVIVERFVDGRELNVGLVGRAGGLDVLPLAEIEFHLPPGMPRIVTYGAKWVDGSAEWGASRVVCPAAVPAALAARVEDVARRAALALGVRDYGRVDVRVDDAGTPWVLEVNPNPDLAPDAGFANAGRAHGLTYDDLVHRILASAELRASRDPRLVAERTRRDRAQQPLADAAAPARRRRLRAVSRR